MEKTITASDLRALMDGGDLTPAERARVPSVAEKTLLEYGLTADFAEITTANLTLYVRTTGDDANTGLTSGTALKTIQAAINKIPLFIAHTVVVDIGEGTFGGFTLPARTYTAETASLTIKGVTDLATGLATGTNSGTATGGTTATLVDSGQSWTVNDLRGRMALVDGEYRVIYSNDATSLVFVGPFTLTTSGKAYQIVEQKTILNTLGSSAAVVLVTSQTAPTIDPMWCIQDIKIVTPSGADNYGMRHERTNSGHVLRVSIISQAGQTGLRGHTVLGSIKVLDTYVTGGATGIYGVQFGNMPATAEYSLTRVFCYNTTSYGINIFYTTQGYLTYAYVDTCVVGVNTVRNSYVRIKNSYISNCTECGVQAWSDIAVTVSDSTIITNCGIGIASYGANNLQLASTVQNSTSHGVQLNSTGQLYNPTTFYVNAGKILSNGGSGIYVHGDASIKINSLDTAGGTGNTRFGIELEDGAQAYVRSGIIANPLTGAMGDAAIDDFKTVLTWSTDFAANLASVTDDTVGTSIKRRD